MPGTAMSRRLVMIAVAFSLLLVACGSGDGGGAMSGMDHGSDSTAPAGEGGASPDPACSAKGTTLAVSAQGSKFDTDCLAAPAGQAFTIAFDNQEPVVHNVTILESHSSNTVLFRGELFRGPGTKTYQVPALSPGTYAFHCETHEGAMRGTVVVS